MVAGRAAALAVRDAELHEPEGEEGRLPAARAPARHAEGTRAQAGECNHDTELNWRLKTGIPCPLFHVHYTTVLYTSLKYTFEYIHVLISELKMGNMLFNKRLGTAQEDDTDLAHGTQVMY